MGESICSLCCGQIRQKEVHCPSSCPFLAKHKLYQDKRILEKKMAPSQLSDRPGEDILKDERMAWLAFHIEIPVNEYAEKNPSFNDREALLALEYTREKIAKGRGLLVLPGDSMIPQNDLGESVYHMIERCRFERRIIVAGKSQSYSQQEKLMVLDRIIEIAKQITRVDLEGRAYIQAVERRFAAMKDQSREKKDFTIS